MTSSLHSDRKVFGIGLGRTATSTLAAALSRLGIRSIHYPTDPATRRELRRGECRWSILERYQSVVDLPAALAYPQLDAGYPGSKFILTVREPASWLESISEHWSRVRELHAADPGSDQTRFDEFLLAGIYGCLEPSPARLLYVRDRHERNVREHFAGRERDLLILDITRGEGWAPLCDFLGLPLPELAVPHANSSERNREWRRLRSALRDEVLRLTPAGATLIMIDDGKLGTTVSPGRRAVPFPARDGRYAGLPRNDQAAAGELARMDADPDTFVVVAWPALWWLEKYPALARCLEDSFRCLSRGEGGVIYATRSATPSV